MELSVLKKRLSTFKSRTGKLSSVADDLIVDVLRAWESWTGTSKELYQELGVSKMQLAIIIKKGKKLVKEGMVSEGEFREVKVHTPAPAGQYPIVVKWEKGKVIRFSQVDHLVDFLKKVA